jgi:beta-glucanase (GH16 family)
MMVTASIKQPGPASALGYWPGFWMLGPGRWPGTGEIDILEDVNGLSREASTLHCGNLSQRNSDGTSGPCHEGTGLGSGLQRCPGCQQDFHTYTAIVDRRHATNEQIRWYLDGHEFFSMDESRVGQTVWAAAVDHGTMAVMACCLTAAAFRAFAASSALADDPSSEPFWPLSDAITTVSALVSMSGREAGAWMAVGGSSSPDRSADIAPEA